jgi:hypothetical protein
MQVGSIIGPATIFGIALLSATSGHCKDPFDFLDGKWTPVTEPYIGAPILFTRAISGWDANFGWWGQTAITKSDGYRGSHVKVEGRNGDRCYYYISLVSSRKMAWNLRHAESDNCPPSIVLERVQLQ